MIPLKLGISTCPNDTFIYEALVKGIPGSPFQWDVSFADVQTLNEKVMHGELDVAKVSCGVLPRISDEYRLLSCGGAMGYGCGPLLLSSGMRGFENSIETVLPGKDTTASLLFRFWFSKISPDSGHPKESYAFFNEVYEGLCSKIFSQGVVIHEHRFTWKRDGLVLLADLGAFWEENTHYPIPLGCSVAKKSLCLEWISLVEDEIRKSLDLAYARKELVSDFIRKKAQIADDEIIEKHIRMFVTDFSRDIGDMGRNSLKVLFEFFPESESCCKKK
ncbi:MAG: 1,4-dihydroxy-6-naphthoate synthase [Fibrobacteraceae bacterium]